MQLHRRIIRLDALAISACIPFSIKEKLVPVTNYIYRRMR